MHDLLIRRGRIVDGTGRAAYEADLAVDAGRIAAIDRGLAARARRVRNNARTPRRCTACRIAGGSKSASAPKST
jgi:hypothetical protein